MRPAKSSMKKRNPYVVKTLEEKMPGKDTSTGQIYGSHLRNA